MENKFNYGSESFADIMDAFDLLPAIYPPLPRRFDPKRHFHYIYEVTEFVRTIEFKAGMELWKPVVEVAAPSATHFYLRTIIWVPDRVASGRLIDVGVGSPFQFPVTEEEILKSVREQFRILLEHELDEGLIVSGERIFDPHSPKGIK